MAVEPLHPSPLQPLLPLRLAGGLAFAAACHALLIGWALAAPGSLPLAGMASVRVLPYLVCALASVLAVLSAPLLLGEENAARPGLLLGRAAFAAIWQGGAMGFFLMIAARLTPLNSGGIARASLWLSAVAFTCLLLASVARRAYAGLSFFWLFALPVCAYWFAEIFLMSPAGSSGWQQASGPQAQAARACVRALLSMSPATGAAGALTGVLADGSDYGIWPLTALAAIDLIMAWRILRSVEVSELS